MDRQMLEKKLVGEQVVELIKPNMVVGLGTGSTVYYMLHKISKMVKEGLQITGVTTSTQTLELARSLGITMADLNDVDNIDLTIDGADEIDANLNAIKGGGGALLFEKIVASRSDELVIIVDSSKYVERLGKFPLPVEIVQFGYKQTIKQLEKDGLSPQLRIRDGEIFVTDSGHYIVDLHLQSIEKPVELSNYLNQIPSVVENGLFLNMANTLYIGNQDKVEIKTRA